MTLKKELTDICYRFILTSAIALFAFFEIYNFYDSELINGKNIISVLLISLSFNVILLIYHRIHLYLFPAIILVGTVFALLIDKEDALLILNSVMFKLVIIGFASFILFLILDSMTILCLIASAGIFIYMLIVLFGNFMIYPASPALLVFFMVFSIARALRNKKAKLGSSEEDEEEEPENEKKSTRRRRYISFLMPFLLIFPICIIALPKSEDPISWNWAKRLYNMAVEKINEITHELSIKFGSLEGDGTQIVFGYDESMDYDNTSDGDKTLMQVYAESRIYGSCYLKGEVFNTFKDGGWWNTLDSKRDYSTIDAFETYYGAINFDRETRNDILKIGTLKVKYLDLITKVMFLPAKLLPKYILPRGETVTASDEHLIYSDYKTYGTEYTVDYYQLNYASLPFKDYMEAELVDDKDVFTTTKKEYLIGRYGSIQYEDLLEYRRFVREKYTSKPMVRESIIRWIDAVTKNETSDYGKLKAIEEALAGYEYTLAAGQLPDYVQTEGDFLNYFLIEKKSGYCVHYATAFCLLARVMGYPSRVVQGYKISIEANHETIVYNKDGHTWPEVYFEGKGWIAFEPTPGMANERYGRWMIFSGKYSEYEEPDFDYSHHDQEEPIVAIDEEYEKSHAESRVSGMLILIIVGIIIFSMLFLVIFTIAVNKIKRKRMSHEKLYVLELKDILNILRELKILRAEDETLEEFASRCGTDLKQGTKQKMEDFSFFETYEGFAYGNRTIGDVEMNEISTAKEKLLSILKENCGVTYPLHKMRLYFATSLLKT